MHIHNGPNEPARRREQVEPMVEPEPQEEPIPEPIEVPERELQPA